MQGELIDKYNVPGPRYTSYPTVPFWETDLFTKTLWKKKLSNKHWQDGVALYIHLPFCESLCTYCGCNTRITKNHSVEGTYIQALLKEWSLYTSLIGKPPEIKEIHFGGGTPTFFSATNLDILLAGLLDETTTDISIEGHPNSTTRDHLQVLRRHGGRRISFGIQDFDVQVQKLINRKQSYRQVEKITKQARSHGFSSINYDLIYGLPGQSAETIQNTIDLIVQLHPDRIAYYSYAHVPWMKPAQKSFEAHLPPSAEKHEMYRLGKELLTKAGYTEIGMDHFALTDDELAISMKDGKLHRNFMGYTTQATQHILGLGVSSISDVWDGFAQNEKTVESYLAKVNDGELPVVKGHFHTPDDLKIRQYILDLMCRSSVDLTNDPDTYILAKSRLAGLEDDQLVCWDGMRLSIKDNSIVRNVCMGFDQRLHDSAATRLFSQTV